MPAARGARRNLPPPAPPARSAPGVHPPRSAFFKGHPFPPRPFPSPKMLWRQTRRRCMCKRAGTHLPGRRIPPSGPGVQVRRRVPGPPASRSAPLHRTGDAVWVCPGDPGRCRPVPRSSSHPLTARRRRADPSAAGTPPLTSARRPALEATAALRAHRQASGERRRRSGGETVPAPPAPLRSAPATHRGVTR